MRSQITKLTVLALFLTTALFFSGSCVKKAAKEHPPCVVMFAEGAVELTRGTAPGVQINIGDKISEKDTLVCGPKSMATVQIGETGVIKIIENSKLSFTSLFSDKKGQILLEKGQILSKISKLNKGESFSIKTPVMVASVRGTEFSSSYNPELRKGAVSVKEGAVAVSVKKTDAKNDDDKNFVEKTSVETGNTALITASEPEKPAEAEVKVRPISESEKLMITKVSIVEIVPGAEKQTPEQLKQINEPIQKEEIKIDTELNKFVKKEKVEMLIEKKNITIQEIKEAFDRIDEITMYNRRVIRGAVLSRGKVYSVLTTTGTINIKESDIMSVKVVR